MSVTAAGAWHPRGELARLQRLLPRLLEIYEHITISIPLDAAEEIIRGVATLPETTFIFYDEWSGRHAVVQAALKQQTSHLQYIDLDRLVHWVETRPEELAQVVARIEQSDCLTIGRTPWAYGTHPESLRKTEMITNDAMSVYFECWMDFCAGSKGLSRRAAEYILKHSPRDMALRMDVGWAMLVKRAGHRLDYVEVDGMEWETPDQFLDHVADAERQKRLADEYDAKPESWEHRTRIAHEILLAGLEAMNRKIAPIEE